jgi:hypothetical protein
MQTMKKKIAISLLILVALFAGVVYYVTRPQLVTKYMGISLGDSKDQVQYVLGLPTKVYQESSEETAKAFRAAGFTQIPFTPGDDDDIKKLGGLKKYPYWSYDSAGYTLSILFDQTSGKVESVTCGNYFKHKESDNHLCDTNGIGLRESEQSVVRRLGEPSVVKVWDGRKYVFYEKYHLRLSYEKESLVGITLAATPTP